MATTLECGVSVWEEGNREQRWNLLYKGYVEGPKNNIRGRVVALGTLKKGLEEVEMAGQQQFMVKLSHELRNIQAEVLDPLHLFVLELAPSALMDQGNRFDRLHTVLSQAVEAPCSTIKHHAQTLITALYNIKEEGGKVTFTDLPDRFDPVKKIQKEGREEDREYILAVRRNILASFIMDVITHLHNLHIALVREVDQLGKIYVGTEGHHGMYG